MSDHGSVAVLCGGVARSRYAPAARALGFGVVDAAEKADRAVIVSCGHGTCAASARASGMPVLVGAASLANGWEPGGAWMPDFPWRLTLEAQAARGSRDSGEYGQARAGLLITSYGAPTTGDWDVDVPFASSREEALLWGLDVAGYLLGREPQKSQWLTATSSEPAIVSHTFDGGVVVLQQIESGERSFSGTYAARVVFDEATVWLRTDFAVSGLSVWRVSEQTFTMPALSRPKANRQVPDSAVGGAETQETIVSLVRGGTDPEMQRHALALDGYLASYTPQADEATHV